MYNSTCGMLVFTITFQRCLDIMSVQTPEYPGLHILIGHDHLD